MNQANIRTMPRAMDLSSGYLPRAATKAQARNRTGVTERILLIATVVVLPLQDHVPTIYGFSVMYLIFSVLAGYVLLTRPGALFKVATHRVFLAGYALIILGAVIESWHFNPDFSEAKRYGYMIAGAVAVAALCRDREGLQAGLYGYLLMSIMLSVILVLTLYGTLDTATVTNIREANRFRGAVLKGNPLQANLNKMAFQIAEGVVVALVFALTARSSRWRYLFLGVSVFCMIAVFIPMSRGGILIAFISCVIVVFAFRGQRMRALLAAAILGIGILVWAPDVAFKRLSSVTSESFIEGESDRSALYAKILERYPDYIAMGVGAGNYWDTWSPRVLGKELGAHNAFLQIAAYWGWSALLTLLLILWLAYRCLPKKVGADALSLCLLGMAVCLLLRLFVSHNLADKDFSLGLGMLVGARYWLWPKGVAGLPPQVQGQPARFRPQQRIPSGRYGKNVPVS